MKKSIKILLICLLFISFILSSKCFAIDINMNLTGNTSNTNSLLDLNNAVTNAANTLTNSNNETNTANTENTSTNTNVNTNSNTNSSIVSSLPESELGLTNILNILLITIGVVLILLAIAIFIKLRK